VIAVDASEEMVAHARNALPTGRATVRRTDLTELDLDEPVGQSAETRMRGGRERARLNAPSPCRRENHRKSPAER
jgi:hypothetical protein